MRFFASALLLIIPISIFVFLFERHSDIVGLTRFMWLFFGGSVYGSLLSALILVYPKKPKVKNELSLPDLSDHISRPMPPVKPPRHDPFPRPIPPLGLVPKWVRLESRLEVVVAAIERYSNHNISVPEHKMDEKTRERLKSLGYIK